MTSKDPSSLYRFNFRSALLGIRNYADHYPKPPDHPISYTIKTSNPYSLPYTLMSSYACYFFAPTRAGQGKGNKENLYRWKGITQPFIGLEVSQVSPNDVVITSTRSLPKALITYVKAALGVDESRKYEAPEQLKAFEEMYPGIRVPRLYMNLLDVLIAVLCSTHAAVTNGRRWFIFLKKYFRFMNFLPLEDPYEVMRLAKREIGFSMGYRARFVIQALSDLSKDGDWPEHKLRSIIVNSSTEKARQELLKIKCVGPKVADCFLLNTIGTTDVPPVDVNVKRVCDRLKYLPAGFPLPQQNLCQHYVCEDNSQETCPRYVSTKEVLEGKGINPRNGCIRAALKLKLKHPGWIQALLFLHGIEYCQLRKPRCTECPMNGMCDGPAKIELPIREKPTRLWRRAGRPRKPTTLPQSVLLYPDKLSEVQSHTRDLIKELSAFPIKGSRRLKLACAVFISARFQSIPVTIREISDFYEVKSGQLFKLIQQALINIKQSLSPPKPEEFADLLLRKLGIDLDNFEGLKRLLKNVHRPGLSPLPLASAAIYLVLKSSEKPITLKKISEIASISEVTLRKYSEYINIHHIRGLKNEA